MANSPTEIITQLLENLTDLVAKRVIEQLKAADLSELVNEAKTIKVNELVDAKLAPLTERVDEIADTLGDRILDTINDYDLKDRVTEVIDDHDFYQIVRRVIRDGSFEISFD